MLFPVSSDCLVTVFVAQALAVILMTMASVVVFALVLEYFGRNLEDPILTVLLRYGEMHGIQIIEKIEQDYGSAPGFGCVYPALRRLERKELVSARWGEERLEKKRRSRRRYYRRTGKGLK
jgi:hypothetical protein